MNLLSVESITKSFGERIIFQDISFGIEQGQKVALVAKNGSGKTTLLRCLLGLEPLDEGRVVFRNGINVEFLEQSDELDPEHTVYEEILNHDLPQFKVFKEYAAAVRENDEQKMGELFERVTELNAWNFENLIEQISAKLKLTDPDAKIKSLSGGQRKRVALAKVLITEPDFLFLDEPTNHLDLDMIEWLESYLSSSKSTLFMVTHDRYFLEVVCDTIFELEDAQLYRYNGNFSYFLEQKALREENLSVEVGKARSQFKKELEWIRRQPKARGTKQKARIEAFHETKKTASQNLEKDELEINIKMERLGTKIIEMHNVSKSYEEKNVLDRFSYTFKPKERLGIVGPNGVGKSTFLKMLMDEVQPDSGKIVIGETVVFGYYSQSNLAADENMKVIDVIRKVAEFIPLEKGREMSAAQFLETFLFPRSMHYDFVHKLSGGEKRRLQLMRVLMNNPNFLILDEPTNDLDIYILGVLEDYLRNFKGCLIVVSHDRYFMDKMVDHIFVFEGEGKIKDIIGNYTGFRDIQKIQESEEREARKEEKSDQKREATQAQNTLVLEEAKVKLTYKEQQEFKKLEQQIIDLETERETILAILSESDSSAEKLNEASKRLGLLMKELEEKTERWMFLADFA